MSSCAGRLAAYGRASWQNEGRRMTETAWHARLGDILAGLSVAGLLVPEAVAYAGIAGLAPGRALIAGVIGGLVYALVGRSRFAVVSATSSSASILAAALGSLAAAPQMPGAASPDALATAMTLMVGVMFTGLGLFRLGGLAGFVSRPVLRGFAFGLAATIIIKQLPHLFRLSLPGSTIGLVLAGVASHASQWHGPSLALGLSALIALVLLRRIPGIPATLIVMATGIALASFGPLAHCGIVLVGPTPIAMPHLTLPGDPAVWARITQLAAPLTLIIFAESWGTIRGLALAHGDDVSTNRELTAIGLANSAAALVQGMPVGAGFSIGSANAASGAKSRLSSTVASLATLALVLVAGPLIARIPEPVLAAVVISALLHALSPAPIARLFRLHRDQWIAFAAAIGVLLLGVLNGMLAAIALSIVQLLYRWSHPVTSELGRVGNSHDFVDISHHDDAARVPGVAIFRPNAPLFFANAETVLREIGRDARGAGARVLILSLEESDDLDSTALDALDEFSQSLDRVGCRLILARAHDRVRDVLSAAGFGALADASTFSVADAAERARAP
ncbi:SulP family inorganic anion transporter [Novosphingobium sp. Fuku2-ISO-50]|uniref:SulP family inorganic anion transporter n=1 Tax=Novosphingobium sp. Fuku2-ISO-50 TaxID=1739114 RepID=UPI001E3B68FD|nr:SulP family inorganic anion transporter [Novosphingobium sp. Fuku2-ISO-50]